MNGDQISIERNEYTCLEQCGSQHRLYLTPNSIVYVSGDFRPTSNGGVNDLLVTGIQIVGTDVISPKNFLMGMSHNDLTEYLTPKVVGSYRMPFPYWNTVYVSVSDAVLEHPSDYLQVEGGFNWREGLPTTPHTETIRSYAFNPAVLESDSCSITWADVVSVALDVAQIAGVSQIPKYVSCVWSGASNLAGIFEGITGIDVPGISPPNLQSIGSVILGCISAVAEGTVTGKALGAADIGVLLVSKAGCL